MAAFVVLSNWSYKQEWAGPVTQLPYPECLNSNLPVSQHSYMNSSVYIRPGKHGIL